MPRRWGLVALVLFVVLVALLVSVAFAMIVSGVEAIKEGVSSVASGVKLFGFDFDEIVREGVGIIYWCLGMVLLVFIIVLLIFVAEVLAWGR